MDEKTPTDDHQLSQGDLEHSFPIVGIGASAGGLEAFEAFFAAMPPDSGMSFVLVAHLDPTHASLLPELVQRRTKMSVVQAKDGIPLEPDSVYVIPPNKELGIVDGVLHLMELTMPRRTKLPIDIFLRSLAQDQGSNAVCIILSGTGTDGTLGLRAIKGEGGMTMAHDGSAKYDGMPRSAIATGLVDYVLPPEGMPEQLIKYATAVATTRVGPAIATAPGFPLQKIFMALRSRTGHDFSLYKKNTICRRIERRMNVHQIDDIENYTRFVLESESEAEILYKELLIGVTSFFRDPVAFDSLKGSLLELLESKPEDASVRVWVPGCSTGEEAYSIGILLHECMEELTCHFNVQIFASDIDEQAVATARAGAYPDSIRDDVEAERLKRFFVSEADGRYRIKKMIREMLVFAVQNVIKDPPFTKLDLLSCRNLLIYLGPELQSRLFPLFHYSLFAGSILFLGSSETVGRSDDLFVAIDKKWKTFKSSGSRAAIYTGFEFPPEAPRQVLPGPMSAAKASAHLDPVQLVEAILHHSEAPPSVIVDERYDAVYVHGRTGSFLEPAEGKASVNIVEMARPGLKAALAAALRKVSREKRQVVRRRLKIQQNGDFRVVDLVVRPILEKHAPLGLQMVTFQPVSDPSSSMPENKAAATENAAQSHKSAEELELELVSTRENLQTTIEELGSMNEELQSTNEELQSTNEELETSKEELQSLNEESVTVNSELQARIDELSRTNDDMKNLLDSTEIATIFLDADLRIRRFTPKATEIMPLAFSDLDRPVNDLASRLTGVDLIRESRQVLEDLAPREREVATDGNRSYWMRIRPYRTLMNVIDGVVITFEETTGRRTVERRLEESEQRYRLVFELSSESIVLIAPEDGSFIEFNTAAHVHLGYTKEEFSRLTMAMIDADQPSDEVVKRLQRVCRDGSDVFETTQVAKDGKSRRVLVKERSISIRGRQVLLSTWRDVDEETVS